jgi:subtilisin family serine protease
MASNPPAVANDTSNRLVVKFNSNMTPSLKDGRLVTGNDSLDSLLAAFLVQTSKGLVPSKADQADTEQIYVLQLQPGNDLGTLIQILETDPGIAWAEPDYLAYPAESHLPLILDDAARSGYFSPQITPNDPRFSEQWGLSKIAALAAWDVSTGADTVTIAVIDSGIDFSHPDLASQVWVNPGEIAGNGLDDDNNGYIDDIRGWDFVNNDNNPTDDHGHGTQVAGIIAAATNNGVGIAGVCWQCKIMPVKVMNAGGIANYSDIAAAVLYAAQKGVKVINLSLGGYSNSAALQSAIQTAVETYGVVVVAGAGNDNIATPFYPAAYEQVLAVAATNTSDVKSAISNYGSWVDIAAPGVAITTTFLGGDYGGVDGSSYATSFAAGAAGLLRSQNPGWSANQLRAHLVQTSDAIDSLNPGLEGKLGKGRLNANQALRTTAQILLTAQSYAVNGTLNGRPQPGSTVDLDVTLSNTWADASGVQATLTSGSEYVTIVNGSATYGNIAAYGIAANPTPFRFSLSASTPYNHNLSFSLNLTAAGGYNQSVPLTIQSASSIVTPPATLTTQTWTNDHVYVINKETGIPAGEILTIQPGTTIRFEGNYSLSVGGTLIADGTEAQPIVFTSNKTSPTAGDWGQIKFLDSSTDATLDANGNYTGGSILRHCIVEYGKGTAISLAAPYFSYNTYRKLSAYAIDGNPDSGLVIANSRFTGSGIHLTQTLFPVVTITQNTLTQAGIWTGIVWGEISHNLVSGADQCIVGTGIAIRANRVWGCIEGIVSNGGGSNPTVSGNLLFDNTTGLRLINTSTVISNTILATQGVGVKVDIGGGGSSILHNNNLVARNGQYALRNATANPVDATGNWWNTTNSTAIQDAIYDGNDEFGLGIVNTSGYLANPVQFAPAYVRHVTISPDSTLGIETGTFEVEFSKTMDAQHPPVLEFHTMKQYTLPLTDSAPPASAFSIAIDRDGSMWFGSGWGIAHYDGIKWTAYQSSVSLPLYSIYDIAIDMDGSKWFGGESVAHYDNNHWTFYPLGSNGGIPDIVLSIAIDKLGVKWFGAVNCKVVSFDGTNWLTYNQSNSGLPGCIITSNAIAIDLDGSKWFATNNGVTRFDGTTWITYNSSNSKLPTNSISTVAIDALGGKWFGFSGGIAYFNGTIWKIYDQSHFGFPVSVRSITFDKKGNTWFGTNEGNIIRLNNMGRWRVFSASGSSFSAANVDGNSDVNRVGFETGIFIKNDVFPYQPDSYGASIDDIVVDDAGIAWLGNRNGVATYFADSILPENNNGSWINGSLWRVDYDITSLLPRGTYTLTVSGAVGTDGIEIAPDSTTTFIVDYAGAIGDTTPPARPAVTACAGNAVGTISAQWSASDPDSIITLYTYAIGSTPGGSDVVNWVNTTAKTFDRSGLSLLANQPYYITVKARNEGGLWSEPSISKAVYPGSGICVANTYFVYLPMIKR